MDSVEQPQQELLGIVLGVAAVLHGVLGHDVLWGQEPLQQQPVQAGATQHSHHPASQLLTLLPSPNLLFAPAEAKQFSLLTPTHSVLLVAVLVGSHISQNPDAGVQC